MGPRERDMSILAIIQARLGSTRLPGKVLRVLGDRTVLEHVVRRVRRSTRVDEVVVGTTIHPRDLELVGHCANRGIRVFCGSENDVLDRFYQLARLIAPRHIVRITADCPVIDPEIIDLVIAKHLSAGADYTTNTLPPTYPDGEDVEVFSLAALNRAWEEAKLPSEREHVTPYMRAETSGFRLATVRGEPDRSSMRWTLDTARDLEFLSLLFTRLSPANPDFGMADILEFLACNPSIEQINRGIERNEGYSRSMSLDPKDT
jgi:spore coat polysaccharide biosynthesis protein SpsF (cytidylyltransferase family)